MSGFVLIFNRDGQPVSPDIPEAMMARLAHRGPDGQNMLVSGNLGLGFVHFQVTPEDAAGHQPLEDPSGRFCIVFDGRLDNRDGLLSALGIGGAEGRSLPDAELVLRAYLHRGDACFEHLLGPLAVAIVDRLEQCVVLARDAAGDRSVFYYVDDRVLVAASEPYAVLAHPAVPPDLNERTIVRWYAVMAPAMGATFFASVSELYPAHVMVVRPDGVSRRQYWQPDPARRLRYRSEQEYIEHFRQVFTEAVRCRLRSSTPVAVSMSGGYDSTSVAAIAALELAARPEPERLLTFSWVFDELTGCDERPVIEVMNRHFNTLATYIPGDDAWPLKDWQDWPFNPNMPEPSAYRVLVDRLYRAVSEAGVRVLLTGAFGNEALSGGEYWLVDLLRDGRAGAAVAGLLGQVARRGVRDLLVRRSLIRLAGWLLDVIPGGRRIRPRRRPVPPRWLTPRARDMLAEELPESWPPSAAGATRPDQHRLMLGTYATASAMLSVTYGSRLGVDLRFPFRDRRLIELMLSLPAYILYNGQHRKYILYRAMDGILPEAVRAAHSAGPLLELYRRGLAERGKSARESLLNRPDALWREYVQEEALHQGMKRVQGMLDGAEILLPWLCTSMEIWRLQRDNPPHTNRGLMV